MSENLYQKFSDMSEKCVFLILEIYNAARRAAKFFFLSKRYSIATMSENIYQKFSDTSTGILVPVCQKSVFLILQIYKAVAFQKNFKLC